MTTCGEQLLEALATRLATATGVTVERERDDSQPLTEADLPRLVVIVDAETENPVFTGELGYTLLVAIEGYVTAATELAAQQGANDLRAKVDAALLGDDTLGGLARDVRIADEGEPARLLLDCADPVQAFARMVEVDYATSETDPEVFA